MSESPDTHSNPQAIERKDRPQGPGGDSPGPNILPSSHPVILYPRWRQDMSLHQRCWVEKALAGRKERVNVLVSIIGPRRREV